MMLPSLALATVRTRAWQPALVFAAAGAVGAAVSTSPAIVFAVVLMLLGLGCAFAPPSWWIAASVIAATTFRGLVEINVLPGAAAYLDLPLAWATLVLVLAQYPVRSPVAARCLLWLAVLGFVICLATVASGSQPTRAIFYLALLAQPFALIVAVLVAPISNREYRGLVCLASGILALEVAIVLTQFMRSGAGDAVAGTLSGSNAGAHLVGGLGAVGAAWALASRRPLGRRVLIAATLMAVPFAAGAKQIILALPALLLAAGLIDRRRLPVGVALVAVSLVLYVTSPSLNNGYGIDALQQPAQSHKFQAASEIWANAVESPSTFLVGQGPATTVSHAAFLTTDGALKTGSPMAALGLEPAPVAYDIAFGGVDQFGSFDSPQSSAVGLFGDIGALGVLAYGALLCSVLMALRRVDESIAQAAAGGLALLLVLGIVNDWLEQAPFTLFVALLAGLALRRIGTSTTERSYAPPGPAGLQRLSETS